MKKIIILCMTLAVLSACKDSFLEPKPLTQITNQNYWQSASDVRAELNAAYAYLQKAYAAGFWFWFEARSDNMFGSTNGSYPYQTVCFNNITSSYPCCKWNDWYKIVSVANYAIHYIPTMTGKMSEAQQGHFLAEAYFIRAFAYFNLIRIWGDVPLITEPTLAVSDISHPARTEADKVLKQIIADVDSAMVHVDDSQFELYLFSPGALYALATDVAMWSHDYQKAIACSDKLLALPNYSLVDADFAQVCVTADTKDNIFTLKWNYAANGENPLIRTAMGNGGIIFPTKEIYEKWTAYEKKYGTPDYRRLCTIDSVRISGYGSRHIVRTPTARVSPWKWSPGEFLNDQDYYESPITIYRLADILLLRAEAFNQLGDMSSAVDLMNQVRARAFVPGADVSEFATKEQLEDALLQERQFELFFEGKRWFDLIRTGKVESVMNAFYQGYVTTYGGKGFTLYDAAKPWQKYWPVHHDIINENPNIKQTGEY